MFKNLTDTLPHRFRCHAAQAEKHLPLLRAGEFPVVLTHGDLNEMNILVGPDSGSMTGVVDWAEASMLPFGFALYAMDNALGYMGPSGWTYFEHADCLRRAFWTEFGALVGDLPEHTISCIQLARVAGLLIRYGTTYDRGFGRMAGVRRPDDASLRYLDALLPAPVTLYSN